MWESRRGLLCFTAVSADTDETVHDGRSPTKALLSSSSRWKFLGHGRWRKIVQSESEAFEGTAREGCAGALVPVNYTVEDWGRVRGGCTIFLVESFASQYDITATCTDYGYLLKLNFLSKTPMVPMTYTIITSLLLPRSTVRSKGPALKSSLTPRLVPCLAATLILQWKTTVGSTSSRLVLATLPLHLKSRHSTRCFVKAACVSYFLKRSTRSFKEANGNGG